MGKKTLAIVPHETECRIVMVLRWDSEWGEYTVCPMVDGVLDKAARYHTDDEEDACSTMAVMAREYKLA